VSGAPGRDPQSVAVGIFEVALAPGKAGFVHGDAELRRDGVDVVDVEMDEGVRARVTLVFGEVQARPAARDGNEQGKARLELMLPLLLESETPVPRNGTTCVLDVENGYDLFIHGGEVTEVSRHDARRSFSPLVTG
jgi:hypothetical protein